jgi:hypothetical protein
MKQKKRTASKRATAAMAMATTMGKESNRTQTQPTYF